jgi:hypothetical protein
MVFPWGEKKVLVICFRHARGKMLRTVERDVNRCHDDVIACKNGIEDEMVAGGLQILAGNCSELTFPEGVPPAARCTKVLGWVGISVVGRAVGKIPTTKWEVSTPEISIWEGLLDRQSAVGVAALLIVRRPLT